MACLIYRLMTLELIIMPIVMNKVPSSYECRKSEGDFHGTRSRSNPRVPCSSNLCQVELDMPHVARLLRVPIYGPPSAGARSSVMALWDRLLKDGIQHGDCRPGSRSLHYGYLLSPRSDLIVSVIKHILSPARADSSPRHYLSPSI